MNVKCGYGSPSMKYLRCFLFLIYAYFRFVIINLIYLIHILFFQNTSKTNEETYQSCANNSLARKVVACKQSELYLL